MVLPARSRWRRRTCAVFVISTFDTDYLLVTGGEPGPRPGGTRRGWPSGAGMTFKDHFSGHAARLRRLPAGLSGRTGRLPGRPAPPSGAWPGTAARATARRRWRWPSTSSRSSATDPSAQQLEQAEPHPRVEYRVGSGREAPACRTACVDLVAAAQAFHWFDFDRFFAEARRVLAPGGAVAVWTYNLARVDPAVDAWIDRLARRSSAPGGRPSAAGSTRSTGPSPSPSPRSETPPFVHRERWDLGPVSLLRADVVGLPALRPRRPGATRWRRSGGDERRLGRSGRGADDLLADLPARRASRDRLALRASHYVSIDDHRAGQPQGGSGQNDDRRQPRAALAAQGRRVLLVDLDSQSSASLSLGVAARTLAPSSADVLLRTACRGSGPSDRDRRAST